jgi:hypothetical protein
VLNYRTELRLRGVEGLVRWVYLKFTVEAKVAKVEVPSKECLGDAGENEMAIQQQCGNRKVVCGVVK